MVGRHDLATVMWRPTILDSLTGHYNSLHDPTLIRSLHDPTLISLPAAAYAVMYSWWWAWWRPETCRVIEIKAKIIQLHLVGCIYTYSCCNPIGYFKISLVSLHNLQYACCYSVRCQMFERAVLPVLSLLVTTLVSHTIAKIRGA
jgi:hypothetical protein